MKPPPVPKTPPTEEVQVLLGVVLAMWKKKKKLIAKGFRGVEEVNCCGQLPQLSRNLGLALLYHKSALSNCLFVASDLPLGSTPSSPLPTILSFSEWVPQEEAGLFPKPLLDKLC